MIAFSALLQGRRKFALAAIAALALSACGRNGDPLPPPDPAAAAAGRSDDPSGFGRPSNPPITPPKKPFFLDPLL